MNKKENLYGSLFFCKERAKAIFFSLDYFIPLRNSTEMKIHFILSENGEERLASFRLIVSTAVEGCSYADGRRTYIVSARAIRSRLLVNLRSRWSLADMVSFCLRTLIPISRAVTRNPSNELRSFSGA